MIKIGDTASITKLFSMADVVTFAEISKDKNPLHIDRDFAKKSIFGGCVVHGMFVASLFSSIIGMDLPGKGTIYLNQTLNFTAPVMVGDMVTAIIEVEDIKPSKRIVVLKTIGINNKEVVVIDGSAIVKAPMEVFYE